MHIESPRQCKIVDATVELRLGVLHRPTSRIKTTRKKITQSEHWCINPK